MSKEYYLSNLQITLHTMIHIICTFIKIYRITEYIMYIKGFFKNSTK